VKEQYQKAAVTKKIRRYQRLGTKILKVDIGEPGAEHYVLITPGAIRVYVDSPEEGVYPEKLDVPSFSDFVVRKGAFLIFMEGFENV
jgi:hypothetical protein